MFGTTEFDGQSLYAEIPLQKDNSFAAQVPGNVPFHIQLIDKFAMSVANESIWISGRAGEQRVCGGCHEDRTKTPQLQPGQTQAQLAGAVNLDVPRAQRITPFVAGTQTLRLQLRQHARRAVEQGHPAHPRREVRELPRRRRHASRATRPTR